MVDKFLTISLKLWIRKQGKVNEKCKGIKQNRENKNKTYIINIKSK